MDTTRRTLLKSLVVAPAAATIYVSAPAQATTGSRTEIVAGSSGWSEREWLFDRFSRDKLRRAVESLSTGRPLTTVPRPESTPSHARTFDDETIQLNCGYAIRTKLITDNPADWAAFQEGSRGWHPGSFLMFGPGGRELGNHALAPHRGWTHSYGFYRPVGLIWWAEYEQAGLRMRAVADHRVEYDDFILRWDVIVK